MICSTLNSGRPQASKRVLALLGRCLKNYIKSGVSVDISTDYRDLFRALNRFKVKYLVVGAYAVIYYTEPRFTKDIDIWVDFNEDNVGKLYQALKVFGAPLKNISIKDFMNESMVYQMGVAPVRIDIMMGLPEIKF
jgi:hypothetical protein